MDEFKSNLAYFKKIVPDSDGNSLNDEEVDIILMANNQYKTLIGEMKTNMIIDTAFTKIKIDFTNY